MKKICIIAAVLGFTAAGIAAAQNNALISAEQQNIAVQAEETKKAEPAPVISQSEISRPVTHDGYRRIPFGIYLFPGVPSGDKVINSFSVHLLGSHAARLDGVSLGAGVAILSEDINGVSLAGIGTIAGKDSRSAAGSGVFNIIAGNFDGVLGAGLFNITTGYVKGIQASGLFNTSGKEVNGIQYAGLVNTAGGSMNGVQCAGLVNIASGDIKGMQAAGLINVTTGSGRGFEGAGLMNINGGDFKGFQGAGLININAGNMHGFQGAGLMNVSKSVKGFQAAGILNAAKEVEGTQMGVINIDGKVKGAVFGVINVADEIDGFFAGPLTLIFNGETYGRMWADETGFIRAGVQHGNKYFYNSYSAGTDYTHKALSLGYTYGAKIPVSRFFAALDGSYYSFMQNSSSWKEFKNRSSMQSQIKASAGINLTSRLSLFGGASYNYSYRKDIEEAYHITSKTGYVKSSHNGRHEFWPGVFLGVQY